MHVHVCVGIPHHDRTPTAASLLCKQAHQTSPVLCLISVKVDLLTYLFVAQRSPKFCPLRKGKKNKDGFLGPLIYYLTLIGL